MTRYRAALPMYDLPECHEQTDKQWHDILNSLHDKGADLLVDFYHPANEHEADALLRHHQLLLSQTCWGPMSLGLTPELHVLAQPDYSAFPGGNGPKYRSAIIATGKGVSVVPPPDTKAIIPVERLKDKVLAFNERESLSGYLSITADMTAATGERKAFYSHAVHSGAHRHSVQMVAKGDADVAAIDCRTWALLQQFDPAAKEVHVIGWTAPRKGLPYVCSPLVPEALKSMMSRVLIEQGAHPA